MILLKDDSQYISIDGSVIRKTFFQSILSFTMLGVHEFYGNSWYYVYVWNWNLGSHCRQLNCIKWFCSVQGDQDKVLQCVTKLNCFNTNYNLKSFVGLIPEKI